MRKSLSIVLSTALLTGVFILNPVRAYAAPVAVPETLGSEADLGAGDAEHFLQIKNAKETLENDQKVLDLLYDKIAALNAQVASTQTGVSEGSTAESETVDLMNQLNEHARTYTAMEERFSQDAVKLQNLCDANEASEAIKMIIQYKNIYDCSNLPFQINVNNNAQTFHPLEDIDADEKTKTELYDKYEFLRTEIYTLYKRLMQGSIPFEVAIGFEKNLDSESKLKMIQWYCGFLAAFDNYLANNFISEDPDELLEAWSAYRSAFNYSKEHIQELYKGADNGYNVLTVKYVTSAKEREEYIKAMKAKAAAEAALQEAEQNSSDPEPSGNDSQETPKSPAQDRPSDEPSDIPGGTSPDEPSTGAV